MHYTRTGEIHKPEASEEASWSARTLIHLLPVYRPGGVRDGQSDISSSTYPRRSEAARKMVRSKPTVHERATKAKTEESVRSAGSLGGSLSACL